MTQTILTEKSLETLLSKSTQNAIAAFAAYETQHFEARIKAGDTLVWFKQTAKTNGESNPSTDIAMYWSRLSSAIGDYLLHRPLTEEILELSGNVPVEFPNSDIVGTLLQAYRLQETYEHLLQAIQVSETGTLGAVTAELELAEKYAPQDYKKAFFEVARGNILQSTRALVITRSIHGASAVYETDQETAITLCKQARDAATYSGSAQKYNLDNLIVAPGVTVSQLLAR